MPHLRYLTSFESTSVPSSGMYVLATTRHLKLGRRGLKLGRNSSVHTLRHPAPWHRIKPGRGVFQWTWMDELMAYVRELGLDPIIDLVHHTSIPPWLENGFGQPDFAQAFAERYTWVKQYTVFNEPFVTAFMCGHQWVWYPYRQSERTVISMVLNIGHAICEITEMFTERVPGVRLIHVDTCEHHQALDPESDGCVAFLNERLFLMRDLVLGRINPKHPLHGYLSDHGVAEDDLAWFDQHPARIDVLGLDYYPHSEQAFHYVQDQLSWLKYMAEQCERLVAGGADLHLQKRAACVDQEHRVVTFEDRTTTYDVLLSTMPLTELLPLLSCCPARVLDASLDLLYSSGYSIGIGIDRPTETSKCWCYYPEADAPFYRVTYLSHYSPHIAPVGTTLFLTETSHSDYKPVNPNTILEETIQG